MKRNKHLVKFTVEYENQFDELKRYDYFAILSDNTLNIYNIAYPIIYGQKGHFFRTKVEPQISNKGNNYIYNDDLTDAFIDKCRKLSYPGFSYWHQLKSVSIEIKVGKLWYDFVAIKYNQNDSWTVTFTTKVEITEIGDSRAYQWLTTGL